MKNWLLIFSLSANLVLAVCWIKPKRISMRENQRIDQPVASDRTRAVRLAASASAVVDSPAGSESLTWKDIQSDDLKELIRRLRAVGCPEETIQDIILAEVNRLFAGRIAALWPDRGPKPFWKTSRGDDAAEQKKNRERARQERAIREEKSALLVELLGVDPEKERRKAEGGEPWQDWSRSRVAFLPEAKRDAVAKYLDEFEDKMQDFYARNRGLYDAQYRAEQRQLEAERLQGLSQFLSPDELREYELRNSQLANQLSHDLRNMTLTREQYEAIYDVRKKYGDSIYNYGDLESKEARDQVQETQKALKGDLATVLGPAVEKQYERSQDYSYQQLGRLATRAELPADTASQIFDVKDAAEASIKLIQGNSDLTPEKRQAALQQIRVETENTIKTALGEATYKKYLRQGGWWLGNLAPSPRPVVK